MTNYLDPYLIELESKIQILERENEVLSSKAEENLLMNRAFEEINVFDDIDNLLLNTLESLSILLNIQFSGLFDLKDNDFKCISSYALFSNEDTVNIEFSVSEITLRKINSKEPCLLQNSNNSFIFKYSTADFIAHDALIIALDSEIIKGRYFVFINDKDGIDLAGRIPLFIKVIRIISARLERIYYQNELEKLNDDLEQKIKIRTLELFNQNQEYLTLNEEYKKTNEELRIAKEKAEESDRLKTAFLHNISHEIRTPMNAIIGFSALLSDAELSSECKSYYTKTISQSSKQLLSIINDIVDISNIEAGIVNISKEEIRINRSLDKLEDQFSLKAKEKGLMLRKLTPLPDEEAIIITDNTKFMQVISNLLSNAFKFTNEGTVEFGYKPGKDFIKFYVADTGIGIPSDQLTRIFERFYQVDFKMARLNEGNGLGLAISKSFIDLMGGEIWVESEPDKGSTFFFTLPFRRKS